ncbi:hypothetical protein ACLBXM_07195 [Xanthobacteraceae bacterium A53D]
MPKSSGPDKVDAAGDDLLPDIGDADVDAAIEACHGNMRDTIRALLIAYVMLEEEVMQMVSPGYARLPRARRAR